MANPRILITGIIFVLFTTVTAQATSYYVKPDGNDNLDGRSDSTAWKSIAKVNAFNFGAGDDVYFKRGGIWKITSDSHCLKVDWEGTENDPVTIGAYYMSSGKERIDSNPSEKPLIDGGSAYPIRGYPSDVNDALILVNYKDYVIVKNFRLINSFASGVRFNGSNYGTAQYIDLDYIRASGITFTNSNHGIVDSCTAHHIGTGGKYFGDADWGFAFGGAANANHIVVRNSKVSECWSEGIGFYKGSNYGVAEYNYVWDAQKVGIYVCESSNSTIRSNMVFGTKNKDFHRNIKGNSGERGYAGPGIYISHEFRTSYPTHSTKIYGNLVASTSSGLRIGCNSEISSFKDSEIYNNTIVDCYRGIFFYGNLFVNSSFYNNIIWNPEGGTTLEQYGNGDFTGLNWSHNCFFPSTVHTGDHDIIIDPKLKKSIGWNNISGGDLSIDDFSLAEDSPLIDRGIRLSESFSLLLDPNTIFTKRVEAVDQNDYGTSWEIGAQVFVDNYEASNALKPPNLKIIFGVE